MGGEGSSAVCKNGDLWVGEKEMEDEGAWKGVPAIVQCVSRHPGGSPGSFSRALVNQGVLD